MRDLIAAERMKARAGRVGWLLALGGAALSALAVAGFAAGVSDVTPPGPATDESVRAWFTMLLLSAIFAGNFVSRDHASGAVARAFLLAPSRGSVFAAKVVVAAEAGVVYGLLAVACAAASPWVFLAPRGVAPQWSHQTTLVLVGVFAVTVLAAVWGAVLGWVVRNQVTTSSLLLAQALLVDEGVQHLAPSVGRFTLTIAMGAVYRDQRPDLLSVPWALVVIAVWLVGFGWLAHRLVASRDAL